jgi:hypothetical protein
MSPPPRHWTPPSQSGSGSMDVTTTLGTSSRRAVDVAGNVADVVGTSSSKRVRLGIIYIFSNYKLRIHVVFLEFYDHLTCLYLSQMPQ